MKQAAVLVLVFALVSGLFFCLQIGNYDLILTSFSVLVCTAQVILVDGVINTNSAPINDCAPVPPGDKVKQTGQVTAEPPTSLGIFVSYRL